MSRAPSILTELRSSRHRRRADVRSNIAVGTISIKLLSLSLPSFSEKKEVSPSRIPAKRKTTLGTKSKKKGGRGEILKIDLRPGGFLPRC